MNTKLLIQVFVIVFFAISNISAQQISKDELIFLTPEWKGERFADGRPKVPDEILTDGFITLSEKPGVGVEINEEGMRKYATPGIPFFE